MLLLLLEVFKILLSYFDLYCEKLVTIVWNEAPDIDLSLFSVTSDLSPVINDVLF